MRGSRPVRVLKLSMLALISASRSGLFANICGSASLSSWRNLTWATASESGNELSSAAAGCVHLRVRVWALRTCALHRVKATIARVKNFLFTTEPFRELADETGQIGRAHV